MYADVRAAMDKKESGRTAITQSCQIFVYAMILLIRQPAPEVADVLLWIPFAGKSPCRSHTVVCSRLFALVNVIIQPSCMTSLAETVEIIDTLSPRAWVEHLICVCVCDVLVKHLVRHAAVDEIEHRIVMPAAEMGWRKGVER